MLQTYKFSKQFILIPFNFDSFDTDSCAFVPNPLLWPIPIVVYNFSDAIFWLLANRLQRSYEMSLIIII